jgi:hypothetical protein
MVVARQAGEPQNRGSLLCPPHNTTRITARGRSSSSSGPYLAIQVNLGCHPATCVCYVLSTPASGHHTLHCSSLAAGSHLRLLRLLLKLRHSCLQVRSRALQAAPADRGRQKRPHQRSARCGQVKIEGRVGQVKMPASFLVSHATTSPVRDQAQPQHQGGS